MVQVTAGHERGKTGKILRVIPKHSQVIIEGVNVRKKHVKPSQANPQGGVIRKELPIHMSNVSPVADGKPVRVRFVTNEKGDKIRISATDARVVLGQEIRKARA